MFDAFDLDGDGFITLEELMKCTSAMVNAGVWTLKDLEDIVARVSTNLLRPGELLPG